MTFGSSLEQYGLAMFFVLFCIALIAGLGAMWLEQSNNFKPTKMSKMLLKIAGGSVITSIISIMISFISAVLNGTVR